MEEENKNLSNSKIKKNDNNDNQDKKDNLNPKTKYDALGLFILLAIILIIVIVSVKFCSKDTNSKILSRKATNNDYSINLSQDISLNMNYTLVPNVDIEEFQITIKYYDKNNNIISEKDKYLGSVKKGNQYTITINFLEFSFSDIFKIEYAKSYVSYGIVYYI